MRKLLILNQKDFPMRQLAPKLLCATLLIVSSLGLAACHHGHPGHDSDHHGHHHDY